ncbi:Gfo/Idh/MocA family protein [Paenibacillus sp. MBLB4367]|uniref:Gfo/Idh/MocA family protein n=1 Tax=Paenibacillus sp. MBLB4367 TaxID=3384767 RepID=UPI0039084356
MSTIRWGIIGCGSVTEVKSGPALQKAEGSELAAVMRRNGELAEDYARRHGVPRWYDKAEELIADAGVDAVYVATPPSSHMEYAKAVARAGKPVYVEKPMAMSAAECETMIQACRDAGVPLFVAYYRRALPRFLHVKKLLEAGAIGDIRFVRTSQLRKPSEAELTRPEEMWRLDPAVGGGGHFIDLASHTLDLLDFLLGPVRDVSGWASNRAGLYAAEDHVSGSYVFESGVHGIGNWCYCAYGSEDSNEIVGTKGRLTFATFGEGPIRLETEQGNEEWTIANPLHIQQPLIQTVVDELLGRGTCPSTGVSAIRTNRVMDALIRNYYHR